MNPPIVSANDSTILGVVSAMNATGYFEVECTNDFQDVEKFRYENERVAREVAKALTVSYSNVAVHAVVCYMPEYDHDAKKYVERSLKKTIYLHECEDENLIITADGAITASENGEEE